MQVAFIAILLHTPSMCPDRAVITVINQHDQSGPPQRLARLGSVAVPEGPSLLLALRAARSGVILILPVTTAFTILTTHLQIS
jgi:hypothetical protein